MISAGTPVLALIWRSLASCSRKKSTPALIRLGVMKMSRYSNQGLTFSAGRLMASRMLCFDSMPPNTVVT